MVKIYPGYVCMPFDECPEELVGSAVDKHKRPINFDRVQPDDIVCIKVREEGVE